MPRTAFVTGGTGFLGGHVVEQLAADGWDVVALHRPSSDVSDLRRLGVRLVEGDVTDRASLERALPPGVGAVFHVAADVSFWSARDARQRRINVEGTRNVLDVARARGVGRFVHTSSIAVYGFQPGVYDESAPKLGRGSRIGYFATKAEAEDLVLKAAAEGLDAVVLNPSNIVGPRDRANWARLFRQVKERRLPGIGRGIASFCHVAEVARAHLAAIDRGRAGANYLLGGADARYDEVAALVAELVGARPPRSLPGPVVRLAGRLSGWASRFTGREPDLTPELAALVTGRQTCRSDRAVAELGYRPVALRAMFEDSHRWLEAEGLL
jgi:nucleoside-diphosphate-sugar epimerase